MADEQLRDYVLQRADDDDKLSEQARLVVLAAFSGDDDLAEVLSDDATSQEVIDALNAPEAADEVPVGAYLTSIAVQGFRGIGANVEVQLQPGPGLVVVAGRNGSGKSTLAEGLELALTGINSRWANKGKVWSQVWRNLHAGEPAKIRITMAEQGSGATVVGVDWPAGDVPVTDMKRWVQRAGQKQEDPSVLGWSNALAMHRPMLSYDELGGILEGTQSEFYDQLYKLLGLEQLTVALNRLDAEVKTLKEPAAVVKKARDALKPQLEAHDDPRAATALALIAKTKPDLEAVAPLITDNAASTAPAAWRQAAALSVPEVDEVEQACTALRDAAAGQAEAEGAADTLAADRVQFLETSLEFHDRHGTQPCPVCAEGTLDDDWVQRARAALTAEQDAASSLRIARSAAHRARQTLVSLVRAVPAPPAEDGELLSIAAARVVYEAFSALPVDDDAGFADHVELALPDLRAAYDALRREAGGLINSRDDAWHPVAVDVAAWLKHAGASAAAAPKLKIAIEAQKWLQENAATLRNERMAPLANKAKEIWAALRQESNVDLAAIRLEGQKTSRRVELRAGVDGTDTEALGVMSQGELQALALAIFIPRATSQESPFRFVVLDDPIQAMDPSKIEGFLQVLGRLAVDRQVIVFTHDDRLPAAIRRSSTKARVIEVTRSVNSSVVVDDSINPAKRALDDAYKIARDEAVPDEVKKKAVGVLCREAFEMTLWDVYSSREFGRGASPIDVEVAWESATTVRLRIALALGSSTSDTAAVDKWIDGRTVRKVTLGVVNRGVHEGVHDFVEAVKAVRASVADLARAN
jgi:ABC-type hemin transport system ATPase subunit